MPLLAFFSASACFSSVRQNSFVPASDPCLELSSVPARVSFGVVLLVFGITNLVPALNLSRDQTHPISEETLPAQD